VQVRGKLGLDTPEPGEELLQAPPVALQTLPGAGGLKIEGQDPAAKPPAKGAPQPPQPPAAAPALQAAASMDAIDASIERMLAEDGWRPMIAPIVDGLQAEIAAAKTIDDVKALLAERLKTMDVDKLAETMARAAFSAQLAGLANDRLS
jgi:phage gp29-like protein